MSIRPSTRGTCLKSSRSLVTLAVGLGAPSGPSFCAIAGADTTNTRSVRAIDTRRMRARNVMTIILPLSRFLRWGLPPMAARSDLDPLVISRHPAPRAGAVTAFQNPFLVNLGNDVAITRQQRLGGAH